MRNSLYFALTGSIAACFAMAPALAQTDTAAAPVESFLEVSDAELDIGAATLAVAAQVKPGLDLAPLSARLDAMAAEIGLRLDAAATPEQKLQVLSDYLYDEQGYGRREVLPPEVFVGFDELLARQQWNCLGLSVLYLALGERTDLPLTLMSGPGHVFVRFEDGDTTLYVETTEQGRDYDSTDYLKNRLPFPCLNVTAYRALGKRETVAVILSQTGLALQAKRGYPAALPYYELALRFNPRDAEAQAGVGFVKQALGDLPAALEALSRAHEFDPTNVEISGGLANVLYQMNRYDEAAAQFRAVLQHCPSDPRAHFNLAQLLFEQQKYDESIRVYTQYLAIAPDDPDAYFNMALPLEDSGDLEGAIDAYRRSLELNPRQAAAQLNLGLVLEKVGDITAAEAAYEGALNVDGAYAPAHTRLGWLQLQRGKPDEAIKQLHLALRLDPKDPETHLFLGRAYQAKGLLGVALNSYERAASFGPDDAEILREYAEALEANNDSVAAQAVRERRQGLEIPAAADGSTPP